MEPTTRRKSHLATIAVLGLITILISVFAFNQQRELNGVGLEVTRLQDLLHKSEQSTEAMKMLAEKATAEARAAEAHAAELSNSLENLKRECRKK